MIVIVGSVVGMDWQPKYQSTKFEHCQQQIPHASNIYGYTVQNYAIIFSLKVISKIFMASPQVIPMDWSSTFWKGYLKVTQMYLTPILNSSSIIPKLKIVWIMFLYIF